MIVPSAVLNVADYAELGVKRRKHWEIAMAMRALEPVSHPEAEILGVGAGLEDTIYLLSNKCKRVFATDLYLDSGIWHGTAPLEMMKHPEKFAPAGVAFDRRRIVVQHADMLDLPYEDGSFDGIFSSGSIEHVGDWEQIAQAAREMGRVLKRGGILSLSTEWLLSGDGDGWEGVKLFNRDRLFKYLVEPSECAINLGEIRYSFDGDLSQSASLEDIVRTGQMPEVETHLHHAGFVFTSIHLALKKEYLGF